MRGDEFNDRVFVYQSDNLKDIPRSEMWNLIVSNPPHFIDQYEGDIRAHDPDWRIHRGFFEAWATTWRKMALSSCKKITEGQSLKPSDP
jgi:hypothetical protein